MALRDLSRVATQPQLPGVELDFVASSRSLWLCAIEQLLRLAGRGGGGTT